MSDFLVESVLRGVMGGRRKKSTHALKYLTGSKGSLWANPNVLLTAAGVAWGIYETLQQQQPPPAAAAGTPPALPTGAAPPGGPGVQAGAVSAGGPGLQAGAVSSGGPGVQAGAVSAGGPGVQAGAVSAGGAGVQAGAAPPGGPGVQAGAASAGGAGVQAGAASAGGAGLQAGPSADASRVIQLAISAAFADGAVSDAERAAILAQAGPAAAPRIERELAARRPLAEILAGVGDPAQRATLYVLAYTIVRADEQLSGAERIYLAQVANLLGLDAATVQTLERETARRIDASA